MSEDIGRRHSYFSKYPEHEQDVSYIQQAHQGQKRHHGTPYFLHPIAVSEIVETVARSEGIPYDSQLRKACLLHDCVEDNPEIAWSDLVGLYGTEIVSWLKPVTKVKPANWRELEHQDRLRWTIKHYRELRDAPLQSRVIKIADRIHNLSEMGYSSFWFQQQYLLDTTLLIGAIKGTVRPETLELLVLTLWKQSVSLVNAVP